jgi:DNA-binding protein HU-beta
LAENCCWQGFQPAKNISAIFGTEKMLTIFVPLIKKTNRNHFNHTTSSNIMNKAELIEQVAGAAELTKSQANAAVDAFTSAIAGALQKGDRVTLVGFGTFSVSERAARNGRNPQTGATIKIKATKVPKFKAGKEFSETVKGGKKGRK